MNILFFQHGDFGEAWRRFADGGAETYRDQRMSVDFVAGFAGTHHVVTVAICDRIHAETLAGAGAETATRTAPETGTGPEARTALGTRTGSLGSVGIAPRTARDTRALADLLGGLAPDVIVLRTPSIHVLRWARRHRVPVLPMFADIFAVPRRPLAMLRTALFRRELMAPNVPCAANHSRNASLSLAVALRLPEDRIVPWDRTLLAIHPEPRTAPADPARLGAFYAGALVATKGIGDCLAAVRILADRGIRLDFGFAGAGDIAGWTREAERLGIADRVRFLGRIPNPQVRAEMRAADVVVVASHHAYAEGLPNTLCEGLAARTPVVISDHPAFADRLVPERECMRFRAGDPAALAEAIARLGREPALYEALSRDGAAAYEGFFFGAEWSEPIRMFLGDPGNATGWVARHSLARLRREGRLASAGPRA